MTVYPGDYPLNDHYEEEPVTEEDIQWLIKTMKDYGVNLAREEVEELIRRKPTNGEIEEGESE